MSNDTSVQFVRRLAYLATLVLGVVCAGSLSALAEEGSVQNVVRVEEDWELVVANADPGANAPQVTCTIAPGSDLSGMHGVLEVNHRSLPSYSAGGVQLQVWSGANDLDRRTLERFDQMNTSGETVTWTMFMKLDALGVKFGVKNGTSSTWGSFGGSDWESTAGQSVSLDTYSPDRSVANSSVGFSGNRVQSLVLKEVRWYDANGLVKTESTARVVHPK